MTWENLWANDIDGSALAAQPGKSQGRPLKRPGSNTPIVQNGLPSLRSPKDAPRPGQPKLGRPPDVTGAFDEQFHAPNATGLAARDDEPGDRDEMDERRRDHEEVEELVEAEDGRPG